MNAIRAVVILGLLPVLPAFAQDGGRVESTPNSSGNIFSRLVPTAFQKHPVVRFNVITELTKAGEKVAQPSPTHPAYYVIRPMGYAKLGEAAWKTPEAPPVRLLLESMRDALAANHYVAASDVSDPISLIIVFDWGLFSGAVDDQGELGETSDELLNVVLADGLKLEELVNRAAFVGGTQFADKLRKALKDEERYWRAAESGQRLIEFQRSLGEAGSNFMQAPMGSETRPIIKFRARNPYLFERAFRSFYFAVASAYDQPAAAEGERVLLWQTKMTVDTDGIAMAESLRPLIASAASFFGREMKEVAKITSEIDREGSVGLGPVEVIEVLGPTEASAIPEKPIESAKEGRSGKDEAQTEGNSPSAN